MWNYKTKIGQSKMSLALLNLEIKIKENVEYASLHNYDIHYMHQLVVNSCIELEASLKDKRQWFAYRAEMKENKSIVYTLTGEKEKVAFVVYEGEWIDLEKPQVPKSTIQFEEDCDISLNEELDMWEFKYKGDIKRTDKSKFECLKAKTRLKRELKL